MPNRLATETSPYLLQHADNPVDWYPWGEEALELARRLDKPILLSIGYSACHWCHVMAHESFEDPEVANEMNRCFVNIKVDREERPDLDQIYQTAHQILTRRAGGWPLTVFLTPDGAPFFVGTYFPKTSRFGMPAFRDLIEKIARAYSEKRSQIAEQNASLAQILQRTTPTHATAGELDRAPIDAALDELAQAFDDEYGGIGGPPKFPHPAELAFCLRRPALDGNDVAGTLATVTLTRMAEGGIYDQLRGGFCRYSTDRFWTIPHFEKMLYDNGPLLALYSDAWLKTKEPLYQKVVRETAEWVIREMQSAHGGYYSSLDADSEGVEGKFYVWTADEVQALLDPDEYAVLAPHFGLDGPPNFEGHYWHLRITARLDDIARQLGASREAAERRLNSARTKLLTARSRRIPPGCDDKVLTSWNALTIKGMTRAARVFDCAPWLHSAQSALDFVRQKLWRDGRLLATYRDGRSHLNAYLDDHAFLLDALLELMQADFRTGDLEFACAVADLMLEQFEDRASGGFYFVSHDHEHLVQRPKSGQDGATPSGNGIAAQALQRLGHITGERRYLDAAERTIRVFLESMRATASAHTSLATALEEALARTYRPTTLILSIADGIAGLPAMLDKRAKAAPNISAWVCTGATCLPPVFALAELEQIHAADRHPA
jgi:uncharacterized protein YyaL (SSP411 family)